MTTYTRAKIGLVLPRAHCLTARPVSELNGITWHWTGSGGTLFHPDPIARLRGIQAYHMNVLGYCDIAYNGAFDADGNIYELRENDVVGAHAAAPNNQANVTTLGLVFLEDSRGMTAAAVHAMTACTAIFEYVYKRHPAWFCHRYWGRMGGPAHPTDCPGDQMAAFVKWCGGQA